MAWPVEQARGLTSIIKTV